VSKVSRTKLAGVLEAVADYIDENESQKLASEKVAREERIQKLAKSYETSTGETLAPAFKEKLANLDPETLDHLLKVAKNNDESPVSLGGPADTSDTPAPRTVKEAAAQAENRFLDWLIS
jgi:hypothetical protein